MSLLDDMKVVLRVSNPEMDSEVGMLIAAAQADMERVGVDKALIDEESSLVRMAVACYCKANFGFDEPNADKYAATYRQTVADMLNSSVYNTAAREGGE